VGAPVVGYGDAGILLPMRSDEYNKLINDMIAWCKPARRGAELA
jgi:hypothetical protein